MKRINNRGSHTIEYAIVLACIVSVATTFFSGDTLKNILDKTMGGIVTMLGGSSNMLAGTTIGLPNSALIGDTAGKPSQSYDNRVAIVGKDSELGKDNLLEMEANQAYEVVVDIEALRNAGLDAAQFKVCLFLWEDNDSSKKAALDSNDMSLSVSTTSDNKTKDNERYKDSKVTSQLSADGKTMTYSFSTIDKAYFGMNLVYSGSSAGVDNKAYLNQISQNYQNYVTLQKATK